MILVKQKEPFLIKRTECTTTYMCVSVFVSLPVRWEKKVPYNDIMQQFFKECIDFREYRKTT